MILRMIGIFLCCCFGVATTEVEFDSTNMDSETVSIYKALIPAFKNKENLESFFSSLLQLGDLQRQLNGARDFPLRQPPRKRLRSFFHRKRLPMQAPYLFEGDILLSKNQMNTVINDVKEEVAEMNHVSDLRAKRTLISNLDERWDHFPIAFTIDEKLDRNIILAGIKLWTDKTCLSFEEKPIKTNGIQFIKSEGCFSNLGMTGGIQYISIGPGCEIPGIVAHEVGHALGFLHEQSRYDRNDYVKIFFDNIEYSAFGMFAKQRYSTMQTHGVEYDYGSVMHYHSTAFGREVFTTGKTIAPIDPNFLDTIGQRWQLSFNDIKKMNFAYCNATCATHLNCKNGGYVDPKNCSRCRCPEGFADKYCDKMPKSPKRCGKQVLHAQNIVKTLKHTGKGICYYVIAAPREKSIKLTINTIKFEEWSPCGNQYLELRYGDDLGATGARFCNSKVHQKDIVSELNKVMVIYRSGESEWEFSLDYSINGSDSETTDFIDTMTTTVSTTATLPSTKTYLESFTTLPPKTTRKPSATTARFSHWFRNSR